MNINSKKEILEKIKEKLPLENGHYYIFESPHYYPCVTSIENPSSSESKWETLVNSPLNEVEVYTCDGRGNTGETVKLLDLIDYNLDTSNHKEFEVSYSFDCAGGGFNKKITCEPKDLYSHITVEAKKARNEYNYHWNEPGLVTEIRVDNETWGMFEISENLKKMI